MRIDTATPPSIAAAEAYRLTRAGRFADALVFARQAVAGARVCTPAHGLLATILLQLGRAREAEAAITQALECDSGSADAYDGLAYASMQLGRYERANALYHRAVASEPRSPRFWYNLASSERSFGRLTEAEAACDQAIELDVNQFPSYLLRSELRVQTAESNHVEQLRRLLANLASDDRARVFLGYALGKELDDLQQFDEAFRWFVDAATARRRRLKYDVSVDERKLRRISEVFNRNCLMAQAAAGESGRYIFIVGLPRSGTTLLERILTGLPNVRSNGETNHFASALMADASANGTDVFQRAANADPANVAAKYVQLAGGDPGGEIVVEKLPMNYLYVGAIHRALPNAKIIAVKRTPLDSCFAMYRTLFGEAYPFSYDFDELARYFAAYENLMRHWHQSLGSKILEVVYEDLVDDPVRVGAAVANHCDLQWVPSAVEVNKNAGVSLTASAAQIRRPIYGTSSGRWRRYRAHLRPLIDALRGRGIDLPVDA